MDELQMVESVPKSVSTSTSKMATPSVAFDAVLYSPPTARDEVFVSKNVFVPEMTVTLLLMEMALLVMKLWSTVYRFGKSVLPSVLVLLAKKELLWGAYVK